MRNKIVGLLVVLGASVVGGLALYVVFLGFNWFWNNVVWAYTMPIWGWFILVLTIIMLGASAEHWEEIGQDIRNS